ncbi:hypothetical protein [Streptomyces sp. NPDC006551]|uniref:hypothetical protein n=1 Tax=Streptomyces sp. NPDC006551 TaxID=3157178 RepID=UPI0033A2E4BF
MRTLLRNRRLFLRERGRAPADSPDEVVILVCWSDGVDDSGLPVGHVVRTRHRRRGLLGGTVEFWTAHARTDPRSSAAPEVATQLPDINEALRAVLLHLLPRYS